MDAAAGPADLVAEVSFGLGGDDLEMHQVEVDHRLATALGMTAGLWHELRVWTGTREQPRRRSVVRARETADAGQPLRFSPRLARRLDASPGSAVFVARVKLPACERLALRPLGALPAASAAAAAAYIANVLAHDFTPLAAGNELEVSFPGIARPTRFALERCEPFESRLTARTAIEVLAPAPGAGGREPVTYAEVGGLGRALAELRELLEFPLRAPRELASSGIVPCRSVLLFGAAGVGKALLVRAFAWETGVHLEEASAPEVLSGDAAGALARHLENAAAQAPAILLLDEIDLLGPRREAGAGAPGATVPVLALLDRLSRHPGVAVVATTSRLSAVDPALRRPGRLGREIHVPAPDAGARLEILRIHAQRMPLTAAARGELAPLAAHCHGFAGADLAQVCFDAGMRALGRVLPRLAETNPASALAALMVEAEDLREAAARAVPSALRETSLQRPDTRWSDIGGYDAVKERIREVAVLPLARPEAFAALRLKPPRGLVLHGPPGTGKSLFARAIASECAANFILLKGPEIFSRWVGESEQRLRELFQVARQTRPCILFVDEIDALLPRRGSGGQGGAADSVVNQFLAELDGVESAEGVLVIGATNRLDRIDEAVLRPGRLGEHIEIGLPDAAARRAILAIHLAGVPVSVNERQIAEVIARSEGDSGALLVELVNRAKYRALRECAPRAEPRLQGEWLIEEQARLHSGRPSLRAVPPRALP